jgi:hypothetical protein
MMPPSLLRDEKRVAIEEDAEVSEFKVAAPKEKPKSSGKREDSVAPMSAPAPKKDNNYAIDGTENRVTSRQMNELPQQNQAIQNQQSITPDSRNAQQRPLPMNNRSMARQRAETTTSDAVVVAGNEKNKSSETRTAGGKVFRRADKVWYDSAFSGQRTISVRRNSGEYKKLDAGLRSIADNVGGVVVVVWKGRAYRIQ